MPIGSKPCSLGRDFTPKIPRSNKRFRRRSSRRLSGAKTIVDIWKTEMTIAVNETPVMAGLYSVPSAVTLDSLRPLDQANQRLENKYADEVERISRSMRSAEPMVRMESPRS